MPKSLAEFVLKLTNNKIRLSSYDIIGTIAILDIPKELEKYKKEIANFLMQKNKNIQTVAQRQTATEGKYRIRKIKIIAGKKTTKTINKESGVRLLVDINKMYYSPRFSEERLRIAKQIKKNENVLVLFSGICPYPIVIEKHSNPKQIIAIELNKKAHEFALENIKLNKCKKIIAINADVKKELKNKKYLNWADRIIMPHPTKAEEFFNLTLKAAKKNSIIHLYTFKKSNQNTRAILKRIKKSLKNKKIKLKLIFCKKVRPYSKDIEQLVLDIKVIKD